MLQILPEKDAVEIFRRVRAGGNTESIVRYVQEGSLLMELSVAPDTHLRYEFPYVDDIPSVLLTSSNHYLHSLVNKAVHPSAGPVASQDTSPYAKPFHAAELVEPLLADAKPSQWTSVSSNDRLMRNLIETYFFNEYPSSCLFHKDYFLEDLVSGSRSFCSSLLVNALLAKACVSEKMHQSSPL
jgi:hypothetical protein